MTSILARRGSGKTYLGTVLAEQLHHAGRRFVVIDPVGAWWGLRYEGRCPGLPILILGGQHGDLPLPRNPQLAGRQAAEAVSIGSTSTILDLSNYTNIEFSWLEFCAGFMDKIFELSLNAKPLHIFLDEANQFIPQRPSKIPSASTCKSAVSRIVLQGRQRGLGMTVISQRAAIINKDVLSQVDYMFTLCMTSRLDRKAAGEYLDQFDKETARHVMTSLPQLAEGQAWFLDQKNKKIELISVCEKETYDASFTRETDDIPALPSRLALAPSVTNDVASIFEMEIDMERLEGLDD